MNRMDLIVMLTRNDYTIPNALEVFEAARHAPAHYWGAKEEGISHEDLKKLFAAIRKSGKSPVLEVVAYSEEECLAGAKLAIECECDILLGTGYFDSVNELCRAHNIRYMPFVGEVSGRPSTLNGTAETMLAQIEAYRARGVYGVDLLGYRYAGDCSALCGAVVPSAPLPVCLAGSINSTARLDEVRRLRPRFFTIGSAFLEHCFGEEIADQIAFVCNYINQ